MPKKNSAPPGADEPQPMYYTTKDIQKIKGCCGDVARDIARGYLAKGQATKKGRIYQVPREIFDDDVRRECGLDQYYKVPLKGIDGGKRQAR